MSTVLRIRGYRLFFYAGDGAEPPHVHIESGANEAKFWLTPVALAYNAGYSRVEEARLQRIVEEHRDELVRAWYGFFGNPDS